LANACRARKKNLVSLVQFTELDKISGEIYLTRMEPVFPAGISGRKTKASFGDLKAAE
jgi:hypothetical protein